jgi:hypothetical protein
MDQDAGRGERLQIILTGNELAILNDFRLSCVCRPAAAAIRKQLKRGLAAEGFEAAAFGLNPQNTV